MKTLILSKGDTEKIINMGMAIEAVREAYISFSHKLVTQPPIMCIDVPENNGEIDVKGGYAQAEGIIAVKSATAFFDNPRLYGLPSGLGVITLFSAKNGHCVCFMDGSYVTAFRTGAAGGVTAQVLARKNSRTVGVIGAGEEARMQVRSIREVLPIQTVKVWSPVPAELIKYKEELEPLLKIEVITCANPQQAVIGSDIVVTTTPSRKPLVMKEWLQPGTFIVAIGADMPGKQELDTGIFAGAKIVVDSLAQCVKQGETSNPIKAGIIKESDIHGEIGEILSDSKPGRVNDQEIIIFDSTGMSAQDIFTANRVYQKAIEMGIGTSVEFI